MVNVHCQKAVIPELRAELVKIFQRCHTKKVCKIIVAQPGSSGLASRIDAHSVDLARNLR